MKNIFFYGTLRHLPLLEIVLGRASDTLDVTATTLPDYLVSSVAEGPFPMIAVSPGDVADGILLRNLAKDDVARLDFYEGSFAYDLVQANLSNGETADVYVPQPGRWTPQGPWVLTDWERDWGDLSRHAAREVMGYIGTKTRDEVAAMFPMIRKRAGSQVNAAASHHGVGTLHGKVEVLSRTRSYAYFYALDDMQVRHEQFDGTMSNPLARAAFIAADAAVMLPYDPVRDRVLLVEQIRMGPLARGDKTVWQLEPIAGHIDPGETPEQTVHREALEEAGLTVSALEKVAEVYASPGNSTEFYYLFVGIADLLDKEHDIGGLDTEGEDIRSHILSFDALMDLVNTLDAANAPLVMAAYWLAYNRTRLRDAHGVKA